MRARVILQIMGLLLMLFSVTMVPPMAVSLLYGDGSLEPFAAAFVLILCLGTLLWLPQRKLRADLRVRDGFLVVALFWVVLGVTGAVPFMLAERPHMPFTDAVFESVSGFTTTGSTVLVGLDHLPPSILFYRQQLQWFGGMGVVVLAVAILPVLGIGGMQLYRAEVPGPVKETKLTPRIAETAKALWVLYFGITVACALAYWAAGMSSFDAIGHAFATVSTGGYSTHDQSFAYFNSPLINAVAVFFMVLSGTNFALHFSVWNKADPAAYFRDSEFRGYLFIMGAVILLVCAQLYFKGVDFSLGETFSHAIFQVVCFMTTSGFTSAPYYEWPGFMPVLLILVGCIGGCASSTAGGLKVVRVMLLYKQGTREVMRLIHPSAWIPVKLGGEPQHYRVVDAVWGFFSLYVASFAVIMLAMMEAGLDELSAFSAVATCLNNVGPALGQVATDFRGVSDGVKWAGCFAMLLGRLEVFTLLVLFSPAYWRT